MGSDGIFKSPIFYIILALFLFIALPDYIIRKRRLKASAQLVKCESNMKNIGSALEHYLDEHKGNYPDSLSELTPRYLKTLPTCPAAKRDTYSKTYEVSKDRKNYTFFCIGENHTDTGISKGNWPQYNSIEGSKPRP